MIMKSLNNKIFATRMFYIINFSYVFCAKFSSNRLYETQTEIDKIEFTKCLHSFDMVTKECNFRLFQKVLNNNKQLRILCYYRNEYAFAHNINTKMFYYIAPDPIVFEFNWQNVSEKIEKNVCKHILYIKNGLACKYFLGDLSLRFTYMRTILQPLSTRALCDFDDPCYIGKVIEAYDPTNTKSRLLIIKNILRDILKAIDFLHANYTTHLQINPNSIVICKDGITNIYRLICYDNMCKYNKESETIKSNPIVSEPNLDEFDDARSIDIFQLGVTGISFYLGKTFYKDIEENVEKLEDLQKNVDAFLTKNNITGDFYDFLINCLQKDPQLYKNAQELLQHPFLKDDCNCDDLQPQ